MREGLGHLEQREQEDQARLNWLRGAAKEGYDQLNRGEGISFHSVDDFTAYLAEIGDEASAEIRAEGQRV